jgi:hypothetical protein
MAMEPLAFHNQFVSHLASDDQNNNFVSFDIMQRPQVACPQFKLSERIGPQALDRFRESCRLVLESGLDGRFQDSLLTSW